MTRPHPMLDEQSFQGLLSAAYTIQEHNERVRKARETAAPAESRIEPQTIGEGQALKVPPGLSVCQHCRALKPAEESTCPNCDLDEFRPGERLQRNWASMWLKSQQQGLWSENPPGNDDSQPSRASKRNAGQPSATERLAPPAVDSASNGLLAWRATKDKSFDPSVFDNPNVGEPTVDDLALDALEADSKWGETSGERSAGETFADETSAELELQESAADDLTPEDSDGTVRNVETLQLSEGDDSFATEAEAVTSSWPHFASLRKEMSSHRADIYLGAAVVVALLALLWPAAGSPQRPALRPWQRALVTLGIAEAPAPVVHLQGDPGIQVWVDPHTALYYCPGEEQFGKTAD
ncbi:MAG: hypothetical protein ACLP0H_02765, partial [Terriglobales bacterium]